ncbi:MULTISPECIES: hypothetical protein [Giesbergeria]|uniref:Uncharacterized protein n=1 Tax=Giesbergeria sinuosa TaxID=80883 RepID=A0ABV9QGK3_9BURK
MPLTSSQVIDLENAIKSYSFPLDYYCFSHRTIKTAPNISTLETIICTQLKTTPSNGLANVIFWGHSGSIGIRKIRFARFNTLINPVLTSKFSHLLTTNTAPSIVAIKNLGLPEYSGISFISKILMFLDPKNYSVLDLQLSKLHTVRGRALSLLKINTTQIPSTKSNESVYNKWRQECLYISNTYYTGIYRAADVERGLFQLIRSGNLATAIQIYTNF